MPREMARPKHIPPAGWISRPLAAAYLGLTWRAFKDLVKRYGVKSKVDKSTNIYQVEDIEALARILNDEKT